MLIATADPCLMFHMKLVKNPTYKFNASQNTPRLKNGSSDIGTTKKVGVSLFRSFEDLCDPKFCDPKFC